MCVYIINSPVIETVQNVTKQIDLNFDSIRFDKIISEINGVRVCVFVGLFVCVFY